MYNSAWGGIFIPFCLVIYNSRWLFDPLSLPGSNLPPTAVMESRRSHQFVFADLHRKVQKTLCFSCTYEDNNTGATALTRRKIFGFVQDF